MPAPNRPTPIEKFVQRAGSLYSLPPVAIQVLELTNCPHVDATALKNCIERDPALVGKILRTVNSSLFGTTRNVSDLNQAVALLGIKPLKLLVLGFSLPPKLLSGIERQSLERYWRGALIKAVAARELAGESASVDADDAFLAGLLQDIGMLVLLKDLGEPYAQFLAKARAEHGDVLMLELETLGFDHRLLSARLLAEWGLPESLWRAVAGGSHDLSEILNVADAMALLLAAGQPEALVALLADDDESDIAHWSQFAGRLQEKVDQLADVLDIALPAGDDYQQIVLAAHARLASETEAAAARLANRPDVSQWSETTVLETAVRAFETESPRGTSHAVESSTQRRPEYAVATATADVLTDPGLLGRVERAVASCRRRRQPLSLLLVEIDDFEELAFTTGIGVAGELVQQLHGSIQNTLEDTGAAIPSGDAQIAVLLPHADRTAAVAAARQLLEAARDGRLAVGDAVRSTLSIGVASVALPAKNFPADALIEAAGRCLFGVQSSGGDAVKSIAIY